MRLIALAGAVLVAAPARVPAQAAGPHLPISIAHARARGPGGDTVTVAGRATTASNILQRHEFEMALQDATGGLRVFSRVVRDTVVRGDSVELTGTLQLYRGDLELIATSARVIPGPRRHVPAVHIPVAAESAAVHAGELVSTVGKVGERGRSEGGQWLELLPPTEGATGRLTIWVGGSAVRPPDLHDYHPGDIIEVVGFVSAYRDNPHDPVVWQLVPRTAADIQVQGVPRAWYRRGLAAVGALLALAGLAGIAVRMTARRHARAAEETEERYRQLLAMSPDAVLVYADGRVIFTNPAAARLLEVDDERSLVGRAVEEFLAPASRRLAHAAASDTPTDALGVVRQRGQIIGVRGTMVDVDVATSPCRYHDRPATMMLARDITEQLRYERDLHALAVRDDLTGLHNRRGFTLFADQEIARARRYGHSAFLLFADLNGLKAINDEFGHRAGDEALRVMSRALRSVVRESDVVARWGGDEFVALVFQAEEGMDTESVGLRLNETMRRLASESLPFPVSASVGGTVLDPGTITDFTSAIDRADSDLYRRRQLVRSRSRDLV